MLNYIIYKSKVLILEFDVEGLKNRLIQFCNRYRNKDVIIICPLNRSEHISSLIDNCHCDNLFLYACDNVRSAVSDMINDVIDIDFLLDYNDDF